MSRSVLFVDDSPVARALAERELTARGIAVQVLGGVAEAALVDPHDLWAAILDVELADGNGPELAAQLRAAAPELPIAFLTASAGTPLVDSARKLGPVFSKLDGVDEAVRWAYARAREG